MNSRIITYVAVLLIAPIASGCVRMPPKQKKPEIKKVILVDYGLESPRRYFTS